MKIHIILNGEYKKGFRFGAEDYIICADGGAVHALEDGILPKVIVGDLDSISANAESYFRHKNVPVIRYPAEKDFTDGELALDKAFAVIKDDSRYSAIVFHAAAGGRIDHCFSHLQLLYRVAEYNRNVGADLKSWIADGNTEIYMAYNNLTLKGKPGDLLSLLPFTNAARNVSVDNVKYPVPSEFCHGMVVGMSNVFTVETVNITVGEGMLSAVHVRV